MKELILTGILTNKHIYKVLLLLLVLVFSCKKKNPGLGTDVQPESDALGVSFTYMPPIYCHTIGYDSSRSFMDQFKYLGSNADPYLGRTDAEIFTNFSLPNNVSNVSFGSDAVLDSAVMFLTFTQSFLGDTTTTLNYNVYQISPTAGNVLGNTNYYYMFGAKDPAHQFPAYDPNPICNATARLSKSSNFYTIKLPINYNFASSILTNPQYLLNTDALQAAYHGFVISTKNSNVFPGGGPGSQGALMKMDLDNPVSGLYLYFHNGSVSAAKGSTIYRFPFSGNQCVRANKVTHNLSGSSPYFSAQMTGDTVKGEQNIFLQGLGGSRAVINIPSLKSYSDTFRIAVSRAEISFYVDDAMITPGTGRYDAPLELAMVALDSLGQEVYIKDQYYVSDAIHFGGHYDATNHCYVFNIARHVQAIMDGTLKNYGFHLVVAPADRNYVVRRDDRADRVILGGSRHSTYYPQFKLTYIRFPYDK